MSCFNKIAESLLLAMKQQGSVKVSFWSGLTYGNLFDRQGSGSIRPGRIVRLLSAKTCTELGLTEDSSPEKTEESLREVYRQYKLSNVWSQLRIGLVHRRRLAICRKVYTITTLRNLHQLYAGVAIHSGSLLLSSHSSEWSSYFERALASVGASLVSLLPVKMGFFRKWFGSNRMHRHITALQEFRKGVPAHLAYAIGESYMGLLMKAHACSSMEKYDQFIVEQKTWLHAHEESIQRYGDNLSGNDARKLRNSLRIKSELLAGMAEAAVNGNRENPPAEICHAADKQFAALSRRLMNLADDCSVLPLGETPGKMEFNHSYVLEKSFSGKWKLSYWKTPQTRPIEINPDDVPGLAEILSSSKRNDAAIKQTIIQYHRHNIRNIDGADLHYHRVFHDRSSPEKSVKFLLQKYSQSLERRLLQASHESITADEDLAVCARQLHAACNYLQEKKLACVDQYDYLQGKANLYKSISDIIRDKAFATRVHCLKKILDYSDEHEHLTPEQMVAKLEMEYQDLFDTSDFQALAGMKNEYDRKLRDNARNHASFLRKLLRVFSMKKKDGLSIHSLLDIFATTPAWEGKIRNEFEKVWDEIIKTDYVCASKKIIDAASNLFFRLVSDTRHSAHELYDMYKGIERIKREYLKALNKENRAIVLYTQKENPDEMPLGIINDLLHPSSCYDSEVRTLFPEFMEVVKEKQKHTHCAWLRMTKIPDEETLKLLPVCFNPAYIFVEASRSLYYLDKDTSLIEKIELDENQFNQLDAMPGSKATCKILSDDEAILITEVTGHCYDKKIYMYCSLLKLLMMRLEGLTWGKYTRDEFIDDSCGLVWARGKPTESELKQLPYSHYIYTDDDKLFYYSSKEKSLMRFWIYPAKKEEFRDTYFKYKPHHVGSWSWGSQVDPKDIDGMVNLTRHEKLGVTRSAAFEITRKEISQAFREISAYYHTDKNSRNEKWQVLLVNKRDEALRKMEYMDNLKDMLIQRHDILKAVPWGMSLIIPEWLKKFSRCNGESYRKFLLEDIKIQNSNQKYLQYEEHENSLGDYWEEVKRVAEPFKRAREEAERRVREFNEYPEHWKETIRICAKHQANQQKHQLEQNDHNNYAGSAFTFFCQEGVYRKKPTDQEQYVYTYQRTYYQ